jgi:hypothetical protein
MGRAESLTVGAVLAVACPASLFILFWWTAAALQLYRVVTMPVGGIAAAALGGLCIGAALDVLCLRRWIRKFYQADLRLAVLAYLFWSAVMVAFFMGLPLGNMAVGAFAGAYIGRRMRHAGATRAAFANAVRNVSILAAAVVSGAAFPIGLLALRERIVVQVAQAFVGVDVSALSVPSAVGLVGALCALLAVLQLVLTRLAAEAAFGLGQDRAGFAPATPRQLPDA